MTANVPRHLNKKPLIAGLEPLELLGVATLLITSNIFAKMFELSGITPAAIALGSFFFLKMFKRGKAKGHLQHQLQFQIRPRVKCSFQSEVPK